MGVAPKALGGGILPQPEKALSETMEKGGKKMLGNYYLVNSPFHSFIHLFIHPYFHLSIQT